MLYNMLYKILSLRLCVTAFLCSLVSQSFAQSSASAIPPLQKALSEEQTSSSSLVFPVWHPPAWMVGILPLVGIQYSEPENRTKLFEAEAGIEGSVANIPVFQEQTTTITVGGQLGYALGYALQAKDSFFDNTVTDTVSHRLWGGVVTQTYIHAFRYSLGVLGGIRYGKKEEIIPTTSSTTISNDFAVLIIPGVSAHYTLTYDKLSQKEWEKPRLLSWDHWFHVRLIYTPLEAYLDAGPGLTRLTWNAKKLEQQDFFSTPTEKLATTTGSTSYFKIRGSARLFWKLIAATHFHYTLNSNIGTSLKLPSLPTQPLGQNNLLIVLPHDTLQGNFFFGLAHVFPGFHLGWYYQYVRTHFLGKGKSEMYENQGIGLQYYSSNLL